MNRLVIVGNGFDLAHGLPTGYCDFIDHFWRSLKQNHDDDLVKRFVYVSPKFLNSQRGECRNFTGFEARLIEFAKVYGYNYNQVDKTLYESSDQIFYFSNNFFKIITAKSSINNWVDIENEYYQLLKKSLKDSTNTTVKRLNAEFEDVKRLLEVYLQRNVCEKFDFRSTTSNTDKLQNIFSIMSWLTRKRDLLEEFAKEDKKDLAKYLVTLQKCNTSGDYDISKSIKEEKAEFQNLFLNFNYTPTLDSIIDSLTNNDMHYYGESSIINIHGKIADKNNSVNFGFGDEMDSDYKSIEEKDDNEYLKNIKSFQYLQNSNYKKLLNFIERRKFQVYLMGHSCGLSDRILLNTIFEHNNCKSIKIFYHKFSETKPDGREDNYTDIVQNISRHFNKKKLMRDKIVNKQLCSPLPQDVRFSSKK